MAVEMKLKLLRSTVQEVRFNFYASADGSDLVGGLLLTAERTLWGGSQEAAVGTVTEVGNGRYKFTTDITDTALRWVTFKLTATNAEDVYIYADCGYPQTWEEIQADLDNAPDGSIVECEPGLTYTQTYDGADTEPLRIKKSVTLEGNNATLAQTYSKLMLIQSEWANQYFWHPTVAFDAKNQYGVTLDEPDAGVIPARGSTPAKGDVAIDPGTAISGASDGDLIYVQLGRAISHGGGEPQWAKMVHLVSLNQKQLVFLTNLTGGGGTFKLTFNDGATSKTTLAIAHDATSATVQTELEALGNIAVGDVAVINAPGYGTSTTNKGWLIEFKVAFAQVNQLVMTIDVSLLTNYTAAVSQKYSALTIDRPVEYTIHQPDGDSFNLNSSRLHNRLYTFTNVARNVIVRNLRTTVDTSYYTRLIPGMTVTVEQAINVIFENMEMLSPLAFVMKQGSENVIIRNITQWGQEYGGAAFHGRMIGGWSSSNFLAENLILGTDNPKGKGIFAEAQMENWHVTNVQLHVIAATTDRIFAPVGSAFTAEWPVQSDNIVIDGLVINAPAGSTIDLGGSHARKSGQSVEYRNICARNTGTMIRHGVYRDARIYDDQTAAGTGPPVDAYHVYDTTRTVDYLTRIDLTDNMTDEAFVIGKGLAVSNIGIYSSDLTGITKAQLKSSGSTSYWPVLSELSAGAWVEPDYVADLHPQASGAEFGYYSAMNWYVDSTYENKILRLTTTTVTPGAYLLVATTCFPNIEMAMNETTFSTQDVQQIRYRLGVDGTTVAPTGTGGALLADVDGKTLQEALRIIAASTAGQITNAGETSESFFGFDKATTRLSASVDAVGNRTNVQYP